MEQRASRRRPHNVRELLPDKLQLHHLPLKEVLQMGQQVHVWSCRLRRENQCHRQDITNAEYNHSIRVKSMALADAHSLACDMSIQRNVEQAPEIIAYTILEVTFDLRAVMSLAQTNKTTWIRCSQVLRAASTECKIKANAPWHKRAGRAVDKDASETPIDIKMYLFNKRMHNWYHHELSYQQYLDLQVRELLPMPET